MEVQLEESEFLKSEWSMRVDFDIFPFQTYGPVIWPYRWQNHRFEFTTSHHDRFWEQEYDKFACYPFVTTLLVVPGVYAIGSSDINQIKIIYRIIKESASSV